MFERLRVTGVGGASAAMHGVIASSGRHNERLIAAADAAQQVRLIYQVLRDDMDYLVRGLHLTPAGQHLRSKDHAALLIEERRPDNKIGDAGFILKRDEHHALSRTGPLPHHHKAGYGNTPASHCGVAF
jgi:hypothetical protein